MGKTYSPLSKSSKKSLAQYHKATIVRCLLLFSASVTLAYSPVHKANPIAISLEQSVFWMDAFYRPGDQVVLAAHSTISVGEASARRKRDRSDDSEDEGSSHDITLVVEREKPSQGPSAPRRLTVRDFQIAFPTLIDLTFWTSPGGAVTDLYVKCGPHALDVKARPDGCVGSLEPNGRNETVRICAQHDAAMQLTYTDATWQSHSEAPTQFRCLEVFTGEMLNIFVGGGFDSRGAYETDVESDEPFQLARTQQGPVLLDTRHLETLPEVIHKLELVTGEASEDENPIISWCTKVSEKQKYSFIANSPNTSVLAADDLQVLQADPVVLNPPNYLVYDQQDVAGKTKEITFQFADKAAKTSLSNVVFSSLGLNNVPEVQFHDGHFLSAMRLEGAPDDPAGLLRISQIMQAYLIEKGHANEKIRQLTPEKIKSLVFGHRRGRMSSFPETLAHTFEGIETADFRQYIDRAADNEKNATISQALKQTASWLDQQGALQEFELPAIRAQEKRTVVMRLRFPQNIPLGIYSTQFVIKGSNFKPVPISFVLQIQDPWEKWWAKSFAAALGLSCAVFGAFVAHQFARLRERRQANQIEEQALRKAEKAVTYATELPGQASQAPGSSEEVAR